MKVFLKAFCVFVFSLSIFGCSNESESDFTARKGENVSTGGDGSSSDQGSNRIYVGSLSTISDNWPTRDCPALDSDGNLGVFTLTVDFEKESSSSVFPENATIPGFNSAFSESAKAFSYFGRGFRTTVRSPDVYGDFIPPTTPGCTYNNEAIIFIDALLSADFQSIESGTYSLLAVCEEVDGDGNNVTVSLCNGGITASLL